MEEVLMTRAQVVSTSMFDAAATSQLLTESGRVGFNFQLPRLTAANSNQRRFLDWYAKNWRAQQGVKIIGKLSNQRADLDTLLPRHVLSETGFDAPENDQLGMVTYVDLSGGFSAGAKPGHIIANDAMYEGVQIDARHVSIYEVPELNFPLVKVGFASRVLDLWMTVPNQPLTEGYDLFSFASGVMANLKPFLHQITGKWDYIEIPEVKATICHDATWLCNLGVNSWRLGQVLHVCELELGKNRRFNFFQEPTITSEAVDGSPTLSFDRDFVVWTAHARNTLVGSVLSVPTDIWQKIG